jgi:hypothetical protein
VALSVHDKSFVGEIASCELVAGASTSIVLKTALFAIQGDQFSISIANNALFRNNALAMRTAIRGSMQKNNDEHSELPLTSKCETILARLNGLFTCLQLLMPDYSPTSS